VEVRNIFINLPTPSITDLRLKNYKKKKKINRRKKKLNRKIKRRTKNKVKRKFR
jgi:hypothetical protein